MTPNKKRQYIIMDKDTGQVYHEGADRRSILPNAGDFKTQMIISVGTAILTCAIGFVGYCGDKAYSGITSSISDLKVSNEYAFNKIWSRMNIGKANRDNQIQYIMTQCGLNCRGEPPPILPQ